MSLSPAFLEQLKARTSLSALIGRDVKLVKAGREFKGCCPFHDEKSASFTVNDEKGFGHCFGCGAHVDALDWLTRRYGMTFIDAVRQLAEAAGMDMPERSAEAAAQAARIAGLRPTLVSAAGLYSAALLGADGTGARDWLAARGIGAAQIEAFGLGWCGADGGLNGQGFTRADLLATGLIGRSEKGFVYPRFKARVMIPVCDARGRVTSFAGRRIDGEKDRKYINGAETALFDKGDTLFNLHRAAPHVHAAGRVVVVEGPLDVVAMEGAGLPETCAPMGTALTDKHLLRLWRLHHRPVLMFDGDAAGHKAAVRACMVAMPLLGPGRALAIAVLPAGIDPDEMIRGLGAGAADVLPAGLAPGADGVRQLLDEARAGHDFLFEALAVEAGLVLPGADLSGVVGAPEAVAGLWAQLDTLARLIVHDDTRAQYLASWRARWERCFGGAGELAPLHAFERDAESGDYQFPHTQDESEQRFLRIVQELLKTNAERKVLSDRKKDIMAMAKAMGFNPKALNALTRDVEADAEGREAHEALWVLYRRVAGVRGPASEALMPSVIDARSVRGTAAKARLSYARALAAASLET